MAAPTVRAVGTIIDGVGPVSPALPAGTVAGDLLLMFIEVHAADTATVSGWTELVSVETAGGGPGTSLHVFWKIAVGGDATLTGDPTDHIIARIIGITKDTFDAGAPIEASQSAFNDTSDATGSIPSVTTTIADCLILTAITNGSDPGSDNTASFSGWTNANLTNGVERIDNGRTVGTGGCLGVQSWTKVSPGAVGATSVTTPTGREAAGCIAISPPRSVAHTVTPTDTVTSVDSLALSLGIGSSFPDTIALSVDSLALSLGWDLPADDTVALADDLVLDLVHILDLADAFTFADSFDSQLDQNLELEDTAALVDLLDAPLDLIADFTDELLPLDDLFDSVVGSALDFTDTVGLIDSLSSVVGANEIAFTDVLTLDDALTWTASYDVPFADSAAMVDSFTYAFEHGVVPVDSLALADLFDAPLGRNVDLVDVAAMNDDLTLSQAHPLDLSDTLPLSDAISLSFTTVSLAGSPRLILKGKAFLVPPPVYAHFTAAPDLTLKGKSFTIRLDQRPIVGKPKLILWGKPATGEQPGLTVSYPEDIELEAATCASVSLNGAVCADVNLVPTVEEFR